MIATTQQNIIPMFFFFLFQILLTLTINFILLLNMYDESDLNVSNFYQNPTAKNRSFIANGDASLGRERRLAITASGKEFLAWASATILSLQLSPDPAQVD
jgi:hypothetical protein